MTTLQVLGIVVWWTGAIAWIVICALLVWIAYEYAIGFARAADWLRWRLRLCRVHKLKVNWLTVPGVFVSRWMEFSGAAPDAHSWHGEGGAWSGFRKWTVHPPMANPQENKHG